ncbi:MAG: NAD(P)/FAD-dependent oxidoreductase [Candidatus Omnitrophica bacterium]|nr:NAD(P)/FAD-dependent oxidoreductase [Candidatus Omnitrophota bacterium]
MSFVRHYDVIVVGGGPAGMMAAISAGKMKKKVLLLEKNKSLGIKLLLTGKGRCNISNACDLEVFLSKFSKNGSFLRDAFKAFFLPELKLFFGKNGLALKEERQARIFPVTDSARSVLHVLEKELKKGAVHVSFGKRLKRLTVKENRVHNLILHDQSTFSAQAYILATGGASYPATGSDGSVLNAVKEYGHTIVPLRPGLVALKTRETIPARLEGLTLKNIQIKFMRKKRVYRSAVGELIFTDDGISGPLIISWSRVLADWFDVMGDVPIEIDLKPGLSEQQLEQRLLNVFHEYPKKQIKSSLATFLPKRFILPFLEAIKVDPQKQVNQITQLQRSEIIRSLKGFSLRLTGPRSMSSAMITIGGVSLKQINPRTMSSKLIKNLYFAGEMLDLDGDTGGYNLQAAFSTGFLAGRNAVQLCDSQISH